MAFEITRVDVWVGEIEDRPGALCEELGAVMRAGADLDFMIARPLAEGPGKGVLFVTPLHGLDQTQAAEEVGLRKSHIQILRVEGPDRPGLGAGITCTLAEAGVNIRGLSASVLRDRCLFYIRFDSQEDLTRAAQILTRELG
jgi:predicted amino acid-binding ACT domain protein